ncbi:hypothetical protein PCK1_001187 [Pneumocystis canis]|nr:hypothetical protein PCK1_001187 [Pneumocystis canis]
MFFKDGSMCFSRYIGLERGFFKSWFLRTKIHRIFLKTYQKSSSTLWMHQNIDSSIEKKAEDVILNSSFVNTHSNPKKAIMTLTPRAIERLKELLNQKESKMIRIGTKQRGCAGLSYFLEYVDEPGKFDERVIQNGVTILIDNRALFTIIGSKMDWVEDRLTARFVFNNPNATSTCGKYIPLIFNEYRVFLNNCLDPRLKYIVLLGYIFDTKSILLIEKTAFDLADIISYLTKNGLYLNLIEKNDVYHVFLLGIVQHDKEMPQLKLTLIYPASETHINKYSKQSKFRVEETPEIYELYVKPYIQTMKGSRIQWVYNILDHKTEQEHILFEDNKWSFKVQERTDGCGLLSPDIPMEPSRLSAFAHTLVDQCTVDVRIDWCIDPSPVTPTPHSLRAKRGSEEKQGMEVKTPEKGLKEGECMDPWTPSTPIRNKGVEIMNGMEEEGCLRVKECGNAVEDLQNLIEFIFEAEDAMVPDTSHSEASDVYTSCWMDQTASLDTLCLNMKTLTSLDMAIRKVSLIRLMNTLPIDVLSRFIKICARSISESEIIVLTKHMFETNAYEQNLSLVTKLGTSLYSLIILMRILTSEQLSKQVGSLS